MKKVKLTCQGCKNACSLTAYVEKQEVVEVEGNLCHRGVISANKQVKRQLRKEALRNFVGETKLLCSGCGNRCDLTVTMDKGRVRSVKGDGCRRGLQNAKKQLEDK